DSALAAVLHPTGSMARGTHVVATVRDSAGVYGVTFDRRVDRCAYLASIAEPGTGVAQPGFVTVNSRTDVRNGVTVRTFDANGFEAARPVPLVVACGARQGVMDWDGLARGKDVVSATSPDNGLFSLVFDRDVSRCVYLATVGGPTDGGVYGPFVPLVASQ